MPGISAESNQAVGGEIESDKIMAKPNESNQPTEKPKLVLTKEVIRDVYLTKAQTAINSERDKTNQLGLFAGEVMHLAVVIAICDLAGLKGEDREFVITRWQEDALQYKTMWFGANASQGMQSYGAKNEVIKKLGEYVKGL